jgi:hypothetical protein
MHILYFDQIHLLYCCCLSPSCSPPLFLQILVSFIILFSYIGTMYFNIIHLHQPLLSLSPLLLIPHKHSHICIYAMCVQVCTCVCIACVYGCACVCACMCVCPSFCFQNLLQDLPRLPLPTSHPHVSSLL